MTYHMSRVRGHDVFHLQVTRDTSVEALCLWLGIHSRDLLSANPGLESEQLLAGEQLVVPARLLAAEHRESTMLFGEWPQTVKVEQHGDTPTEEADVENGQRVSEAQEEFEGESLQETPADDETTEQYRDDDAKTAADEERPVAENESETDEIEQRGEEQEQEDEQDPAPEVTAVESTVTAHHDDVTTEAKPSTASDDGHDAQSKPELESGKKQQSESTMMWRPFPKSDL